MMRWSVQRLVFAGVLVVLSGGAFANAFTGEYTGTYYPDRVKTLEAKAMVVPVGDSVYRILVSANGEDGVEGTQVEIYGAEEGNELLLFARSGGYGWGGEIRGEHLSIRTAYHQHFELDKTERHSSTERAEPPENALVLLPYKDGEKPDISAWTNDQWEALDSGAMRVKKGAGNTKTKQEFTDIEKLHIEFKLPVEQNSSGQGRGNSGVFLNGNYEVQILDSFGVIPTSGDCGGIYNLASPMKNVALPPGAWQTFDISFKTPQMQEDGTVTQLPRITVLFNGVKVHDDLEIPYSTYADQKGHIAQGSIELQDHGHLVEFRNIWVVQ